MKGLVRKSELVFNIKHCYAELAIMCIDEKTFKIISW